jgi:hypothetical protein
MNNTGYFWYSENMKYSGGWSNPVYCNINGKVQEYTLWTDTPEHSCGWDDMQLLGFGEYVGHSR